MGLQVDQKVKLKDSYNGYFRDMKGFELTVARVFAPERASLEPEKICVREIQEIHLLRSDNFEVLS